MPSQKPTAAGTNDQVHMLSACSKDGIKRLHTDAATITPAAKPARIRFNISLMEFFIKRTHADPRLVPKKGINIP